MYSANMIFIDRHLVLMRYSALCSRLAVSSAERRGSRQLPALNGIREDLSYIGDVSQRTLNFQPTTLFVQLPRVV